LGNDCTIGSKEKRTSEEQSFSSSSNREQSFSFLQWYSSSISDLDRPGAKSLDLLLNRSELLGKHLGPVLWQLPGTLKKDLPRLEAFLRTLNHRIHHAIEFRDPSWEDEEVFETLREYRVANVALSSKAMPKCFELTAGFAYVRFHGLEGGASHDYTDQELRPWATFLRDCAGRGVKAFAYFNNDLNTRAPLNARRLMDLVGAAARSPS
jgi:uncharacterized protein YecE (DUF72 family)